jgi:hypothetical protein
MAARGPLGPYSRWIPNRARHRTIVLELVARELGEDRVIGLYLMTPVPLGGLQLRDDVAGPLERNRPRWAAIHPLTVRAV